MTKLKNLRYVAAACVGVTLLAVVHARPTGCNDDAHCPTGFYCETSNFCRKCLRCEDVNRAPSTSSASCVKSITDCGTCLADFAEDKRGKGNTACVPPDKQSEEQSLPVYLWAVIIAALLLLAVALCAAGVFVLRNFETFNILASTRASVRPPCASEIASAPPPPPPYNALSVAPTGLASTADEELTLPFIKPVVEVPHGEARESAGHQATRVFNAPSYVRGPLLPPSYEEIEETTPPTAHSEATTDSSNLHSNNSVSGSPVNPEPKPVVQRPLRVRKDSNSTTSEDGEYDSGPAPPPSFPPYNCPPLIINVVKTITTVQQQNGAPN